jgi:hypothetical protein
VDPTASFRLIAKDDTEVGIASANKNLQTLTGTVREARRVFSAFGVTIGVRAFANWISSALEAKDLTQAQIKDIAEAKEAVSELDQAWNDVARSMAKALAPSIANAAQELRELRQAFDPTDVEIYNKELSSTLETLGRLDTALSIQKSRLGKEGLIEQILDPMGREAAEGIANLERQIAEAQEHLRQLLLKPVVDPGEATDALQKQMQDFIDHNLLPELRTPKIELEVLPDFEKEAWDKEFAEWVNRNTLPVLLTPKIELEEIDLNPISDDLKELGNTLGRGLRASFKDFLTDADYSFRNFLQDMAAEFATSVIFSALATAFGGPATFLGGVFGGFKARGGPLDSGKWYVAGEHGPEPIWGGGAGAFAAGYGGGGMAIQLGDTYIDARGADPSLAARLPAILDASERRTVAKVSDLLSRKRL